MNSISSLDRVDTILTILNQESIKKGPSERLHAARHIVDEVMEGNIYECPNSTNLCAITLMKAGFSGELISRFILEYSLHYGLEDDGSSPLSANDRTINQIFVTNQNDPSINHVFLIIGKVVEKKLHLQKTANADFKTAYPFEEFLNEQQNCIIVDPLLDFRCQVLDNTSYQFLTEYLLSQKITHVALINTDLTTKKTSALRVKKNVVSIASKAQNLFVTRLFQGQAPYRCGANCSNSDKEPSLSSIFTTLSLNPDQSRDKATRELALRRAACRPDISISEISLLLESGVDIDAQGKDTGNTALLNSMLKGQYKKAELLLSKGAKLDVFNNEGVSAQTILESLDIKIQQALMKKQG